MPLTSAGAVFLAQAAINDSPTFFTQSNSYLGVGDSSTAFSTGHTDLQASTNKIRKQVEIGYPQRSGGALTFRSIFGTTDANFTWNEWGTFNASSGGTMLNRKVEALGTKTSAASWQLTVTNTLSA